MTVVRFARPARTESDTKTSVWRCELCQCFHLRADHVLLSFSEKEFAVFAEEVVDCFSPQTIPTELNDPSPVGNRNHLQLF